MSFNTFIAITGEDLARATRSAGGEWSVEFLLAGEDLRCLAADPHNGDVVYAGTQGNGLLRSLDRGQTWHPAGLEDQVIKSIAFSRSERPEVQTLLLSHRDSSRHTYSARRAMQRAIV